MSYPIEIDDVLECIDDAQDGSKKTYDILADVFNRVLALPSAEAEPMMIRCKEQLTEEDFRAIAIRIREENQNVIVIPCETEVVSSAEPKTGKWKCMGDCGVTECDQCGWSIEEYVGDYNYCPNCGAKMTKGDDTTGESL